MFRKNRIFASKAMVAACLSTVIGSAVVAQPLQHRPTAATSNPLTFTEINESTSGACNVRQCANLHVRTIRFENQTALTAYLTKTLLSMAVTLQDKPATFSSVAQLQQYFWENATPEMSEYLQINALRSQKNVVVTDLVRYIDSGGAHGETESQYVNWIVQSQQAIAFKDMILPGAEAKFEQVLQQAHQEWLQNQGQAIDDIQAFKKMWPFQSSHNVALMADGLQVTYARYAIAPGSFGQPSMTIPYAQLRDIFKPAIIAVAQSD